jgi:transcription antitermination factor NusG
MRGSFQCGERVRVNDGVFCNFTGVVESVDPERRTLTLGLTIFSRRQAIELRFAQVEDVAGPSRRGN